jgi:LacI family transcriptional regulator
MDMSGAYARGLVEGVGHYIRDHQVWELQIVDNLNASPPIPAWFASWKGDGIIARIDTPAVAKVIARMQGADDGRLRQPDASHRAVDRNRQ